MQVGWEEHFHVEQLEKNQQTELIQVFKGKTTDDKSDTENDPMRGARGHGGEKQISMKS